MIVRNPALRHEAGMDLPRFLTTPLLLLAWLILTGAPVAGYLLRTRLKPALTDVLKVLFVTALIPALILTGISTVNQTVNIAFCFFTYAGYAFLASYSFAIPNLALRIVAAAFAYVPIVIGYVFSTFGAVALLFLMAQSYPLSSQTMRPGLACEIHGFGLAGGTGASGYNVSLYSSFPALPWFRRLIYSVSVEVVPGAIGPWPGCTEILHKYDARKR